MVADGVLQYEMAEGHFLKFCRRARFMDPAPCVHKWSLMPCNWGWAGHFYCIPKLRTPSGLRSVPSQSRRVGFDLAAADLECAGTEVVRAITECL